MVFTKSHITNLLQAVPEYIYKQTQTMHIYAKYASRCRNFKIFKNMQYQICRKYAPYAQMKYAKYMFYMLVYTKICKSQICIICKYPFAYICKICRNMQN